MCGYVPTTALSPTLPDHRAHSVLTDAAIASVVAGAAVACGYSDVDLRQVLVAVAVLGNAEAAAVVN
jgi:hypothetical protein